MANLKQYTTFLEQVIYTYAATTTIELIITKSLKPRRL